MVKDHKKYVFFRQQLFQNFTQPIGAIDVTIGTLSPMSNIWQILNKKVVKTKSTKYQIGTNCIKIFLIFNII